MLSETEKKMLLVMQDSDQQLQEAIKDSIDSLEEFASNHVPEMNLTTFLSLKRIVSYLLANHYANEIFHNSEKGK